ncbi:hypothetical protein Forpe1208_v011914 [Fusarium oxysporum f. sp. rapae]|uniref:NAD(+) ADP-ribosyltransferase n=1 Tax=Fusarium oxysporum f. sp. rapae TaxID=485398 RepID=A0A8J5NYA6_FUSOX|nr:hypothetical protein Forpe1208_v011914 [Fusarium oxysporum f. sp. rapae]
MPPRTKGVMKRLDGFVIAVCCRPGKFKNKRYTRNSFKGIIDQFGGTFVEYVTKATTHIVVTDVSRYSKTVQSALAKREDLILMKPEWLIDIESGKKRLDANDYTWSQSQTKSAKLNSVAKPKPPATPKAAAQRTTTAKSKKTEAESKPPAKPKAAAQRTTTAKSKKTEAESKPPAKPKAAAQRTTTAKSKKTEAESKPPAKPKPPATRKKTAAEPKTPAKSKKTAAEPKPPAKSKKAAAEPKPPATRKKTAAEPKTPAKSKKTAAEPIPPDTYHIWADPKSGVIYDAYLKKPSEFFHIQVVEDPESSKFWTRTHCGPIGELGSVRFLGNGDREKAVKMFERKFKSHSGFAWGNHSATSKPGKYAYVPHYGGDNDTTDHP